MSSQTLRPAQRIALTTLLETGQVTDAARAASVSRDTVHRWLREPLFLEHLRAAEAEALRALSRKLIALGSKATATVEATMDDMEIPASVRLKAADTVLARLLQLRELVDFEQRLSGLEQRMEQMKGMSDEREERRL